MVSQTIEIFAIDYLSSDVKKRLQKSVDTTKDCSNEFVYLPGEKEKLQKKSNLVRGIPYTFDQVLKIRSIAKEAGVSMPF